MSMRTAPPMASDELMEDVRRLALIRTHRLAPWMLDGRRLTVPQADAVLAQLWHSPPREDVPVDDSRPAPSVPRERGGEEEVARAMEATRRNPRPMDFFAMISDGKYATPTGHERNDLDFWLVKTRKNGKYEGRRFVDRIIGGHDDVPLDNVHGRLAMEAILAYGAEESQVLYSQEIGTCRFCQRSLTRRVPRYNGQGNDCAADRGLTQEIPPDDWRPEIQDEA